MKYTRQQLQEKYEKLPEDLKNAIFSVETADIIQKISKKYGLQIDQMGELASETGLVMMGLTHPKDYIKNLSGRLGVDIDTAKKIAQEVNSEIFLPVKEHLKKIHGIEKEAPEKDMEVKLPGEEVTPFELTQKHKPEPPLVPEITKPPEPSAPPKPEPDLSDTAHPTAPKPSAEPQPETEPPTAIFREKIMEKPFRKPSQTTEIEEPKETPPSKTAEEYKEGDPYREMIS